ncbi:uncharacterized protein [Misgurnus anguillicaudatus]|uniref:uncharacterized protein n=1 Tax=Misgurnus anguillicaudatus TaxID=75329 RepID=UPI002435DE9E|nr:uncharacterized protein LOC129449962 [Misgurnus anguillicaudatus]
MSESKEDIETSSGGTLRKQNSAPSGSRVTSVPPRVVPDVELSHSGVRQKKLTLSEMLVIATRKIVDRQMATFYSGEEQTLAIPHWLRDMERRRKADGLDKITGSSAEGHVNVVESSGERDDQRRLCVSAPAVLETRFVLPGAIEDEEWVPAVVATPAAALDEEERSLPEPKPEGRKKIRAFMRRALQAIRKACCCCVIEDNVEPF